MQPQNENKTQLVAKQPEEKVRLIAKKDIKLPESLFAKDANPMEMRDIKTGTIFTVSKKLAEDLVKPISGYPKFQGTRFEGDVEFHQHPSAEYYT